MFAKLFGPQEDQVLVVHTTDEKGSPEIHITTQAAEPFDGAAERELIMVVIPCKNHLEARCLLTNATETGARETLAEAMAVHDQERLKHHGLLKQH